MVADEEPYSLAIPIEYNTLSVRIRWIRQRVEDSRRSNQMPSCALRHAKDESMSPKVVDPEYGPKNYFAASFSEVTLREAIFHISHTFWTHHCVLEEFKAFAQFL